VRLGPKSVAVVDDEIDNLIAELIAERDARHEGKAGGESCRAPKNPYASECSRQTPRLR
jgi:hypothetical protein